MLGPLALMFVTVTQVSTCPYDLEFGFDVFVRARFRVLPG
jgi:hypothetical protein